MQLLRWLYRLLLNLFPRAYWEEYGGELQAVFNLSVDDAMKIGGMEVVGVILREWIGLAIAILYEHFRRRRKRKMNGTFTSRFDFAPGSRNETLAALAPFLLFGVLPALFSYLQLSGFVPLWLEIVFVIAFWLAGLSLFVIGLKMGAPRWFMP